MTVDKTALLVGANGLVGSELLNYLLTSSIYEKVIVFVRTPLKLEHAKLKQVIVDFDHLEDQIEYMKVHDVYCCLGTTIKKAGTQEAFRKVDFDYPLTLAKLAKQCGVQKFLIITAIGADANSKVFYSRVKGEVEQAVKLQGIPSLHIFQPSLLLGKRKEFRFAERLSILMSPLYSIWMVGPLKKYKPITARNVALAMLMSGQREVDGIFYYESDSIYKISKEARK